jgi:riboflavin synthase
MFSGIIEAIGRIERIEPQGGDLRLTINSADLPWQEFAVGESIAVNGVCLTAVEFLHNGFVADVSVEPSVRLGERLGGHLVSGHVDCVGQVKTRETDARSVKLVIGIPLEISRYIAKKGSVCIDGVSLTVNEVSDNSFSVNIIPHTADATIIGDYRSGTEVNIEVDLLARYVERLLGNGDESAITEEYLRAHGYA